MKKHSLLTLLAVVFTIVNAFSQVTCTQYNEANSGLAQDWVRCVEIAPDGKIWVGTSFSGISIYNGSTWTAYTEANSDLPDNGIVDIQFDASGNAWVATEAGLAKLSGGVWTVYDSGNTIIPGLYITAFGFDGSGKLWVASKNGSFGYQNAVTFDGTTWATLSTVPTNAADDEMKEFAFDGGKTWIASGGGVLLYESNAYTYYPKASTGIWSTDVAVTKSSDNIWFAGFHGLLNRAGGSWTFIDHETTFGFPQNTPYYKIIPDGDYLWIAHYDGIMKYNTATTAVTHWNYSNSCLPNSLISDMVIDANDIVWIGSEEGLWKLDGINSTATAVNFRAQTSSSAIYPNPVSKGGMASIQIEETLAQEKIAVKVRDVYGKIQKEYWIGTGTTTLDIAGLSAGNYYVELAGTTFSKQEKITIY